MSSSKVGDVSTGGKPLQEYDPSHNGPIKKRSCTDVICCLIFFICFLGLLAVGVYAYIWGDPKLLLYPQDSNGNLCGFGDYRGKENLFFFDLTKCARMGPAVFVNGCPTPQVCVAECPQENFFYGVSDRDKLICKEGVNPSSVSNATQAVLDGDCTAYYFKSTPLLKRCVPDLEQIKNIFTGGVAEIGGQIVKDATGQNVTEEGTNKADEVIRMFLQAKEYAEKIIDDIVKSWYLILVCLIACMVLSFIWIVLMRWVAGFMVWLAILLFVGLFAALTALCFWMYNEKKGSGEMFRVHFGFTMTFSMETFYLVTGIIVGIIFVIVSLILLFLCQRIRIAIQLIKEASRAISSMMFTLVWPVCPFLMQLFVVGLWISIAVYLASIGRGQDLAKNNITFANGTLDDQAIKDAAKDLFEDIPCDSNGNDTLSDVCGVLKYGDATYTLYLQIFNLFMLFWMVNFVIALGQITLAGAFASYYWAWDKKKDIPAFPVLSSFGRAIRYHLGSIAFGSLIIAIVQIIRVILEYIESKVKETENQVAQFFLKCMKCCFWCLEKFLKFLNKNAYIMIAVYGKNFCVSAKNAFTLILSNIVRVAVVDKVTDFILFISRLVIMGLIGTGSYFFFDGRIPYLADYSPTLNFYLVPIIIVVLGSYIVTSAFFSVYSMAVDTLFICFLVDLENNDGGTEKPYFMSKGLKKILGKKNKAPASDE